VVGVERRQDRWVQSCVSLKSFVEVAELIVSVEFIDQFENDARPELVHAIDITLSADTTKGS